MPQRRFFVDEPLPTVELWSRSHAGLGKDPSAVEPFRGLLAPGSRREEVAVPVEAGGVRDEVGRKGGEGKEVAVVLCREEAVE